MLEINNRKLCASCFTEINAAEACPCCGYNGSGFISDPMVLPPGTKLDDKIIIGRVMGKGGYGITYLGYDLRMDKLVAVKEYYPTGISCRAPGGTEVTVADAESAETFENGAEKFYSEAEMVSKFNGNPNIVNVYSYFRANSTVYLIMEYLSGITLKSYVERHGKLTDGQALYVMDKIVAALSITHSAGVLHRDISPDNIMICGDGKVKLIDFGAARQILAESSSNLTVMMKPGYTPIEQYTKKGEQGAWTDIYSLGVTIYYALTKIIIDNPYARLDSDEEFIENKHKLNESLWEILKRCTMINASDRYGSAIDLRKALKSVSAPLTAEMITLSPEDLKYEPLKRESAVVHTTAAPSDGDFPATVKGSDSGIAKKNEIVESSAPDTSDDTPARITVKQAKSSGNGKLTAAICSAAALVIVVVICVVVGINKHKAPDITSEPSVSVSGGSVSDGFVSDGSTSELNNSSGGDIYNQSYPEMKDGKLLFENNNRISKENLMRFDGDVKVTLEFEDLLIANWNKDVLINDYKGEWVDVIAFNKGVVTHQDRSDDYEIFFPEQREFSFVISRSIIDNIDGGLLIGVSNGYVKSAVAEAYDHTELEPGKDAVLVDIYSRENNSTSFIPLDILQSFDSDVKITLDIEYEKMEPGTGENINACICPCDSNHRELTIEVNNNTLVPWWTDDEDPHMAGYRLGYKNVPDKFVFTLPKSEIAKLDATGFGIFSQNLYIKTAAVEKAP